VKKRKKKIGKRFAPIFAPSYIDIIAVDSEGNYYRLDQVRNIEYTGNMMRIYVRKP
jgi:hypothetical protein